jgi:hypothetical protein
METMVMSNHETPDPLQDGEDHINVWTKGKTRLGRLLTNPADLPVTHPKYGMFRTMEGLWFYLKTGMIHEDLRAMNGFEARRVGMTFKTVWFQDFMDEIKIGIRCKIEQHAELRELMEESILPFEHYYVYPVRTVTPKSAKALCQMLEDIRSEMFK